MESKAVFRTISRQTLSVSWENSEQIKNVMNK